MYKSIIKPLILGAAVSLLWSNASACDLNDWSQVNGTPIAGEPDDPTPVPRYSGLCALQMDAVGDYVVDTNPTSERTYYARFYYYTGNVTGGDATIFQALGAPGASGPTLQVQHNGEKQQLYFNVKGSGQSRQVNSVLNNRWYAIELDWEASTGSDSNNGSLHITVTGAANPPVSPPPFTGLNNPGDTIETVRLGLIAGPSGVVNFDAFEARRQTSPGRLCIGDVVVDGEINVLDVGAIIGEINGTSLASGQPDANEDGSVDVLDLGVLVPLINAGATCS